MSVTVARAEPSIAGVGDYIELMKPRAMSLVVFPALVGLVVAPVPMHPVMAFTALLCIAVGAGAAGALNMWYDADIDARMARTAARPIPAGRLAPGDSLAFGLTLAAFSVVVLGLLVNVFAALLLALTIAFYVCVYTMGLRRTTPQNIVIGGAAGALPPVIGWAAVTGGLALEPLVLFLIIFFGRRRISGRCRSIVLKTMCAPASPCCRWSPVRRKRAGKSFFTLSCSRRSALPLGCLALPASSTASSRSARAP